MPAIRELQAVGNSDLPMAVRLKRLETFHHSPEIAARLTRIFGTDRPLTVTALPPVKNQLAYLVALVPLHYVGPDGASADWTAFNLRLLLDKPGNHMSMAGGWPSLDVRDKDMHLSMRKLSVSGRQHRGYGGLWFGNARIDVERLAAEPQRAGLPGIAFENVRVDTLLTEHPKAAEVRYGIGVKAIAVGGERVDDFRMALRVTNIDKRALVAMKAFGDQKKLVDLTPEQKVSALKPALKDMARALVKGGAAIDIDDISGSYHGSRASIKGRITVEGASDADMGSIPALLKKIVARFEVRVPVAIVRAIAGTIAQKQQSRQHPGNPPDPQGAAQMGQTMTDVVVGKLLGGGFAKLENDVLVSTIEWRDGRLTANGKEIPLPRPGPRPGNGQHASAQGQWLQARRVEGSCTLPDYPQDVVREDRPLQFTLRFMVGTDGHPHDLSMARSSELPDYDKAVLAAAARCAYVPALHEGKPAEVPMTWSVVREPGSARP